jgi:hypothetical protein
MTNVKKGTKGFVEIDARARFDAKVDKTSGPDACWPWLGTTDARDRGQFWLGGRRHRAPRIAWSLHHSRAFPDELLACHTCDNPNCVNPSHIWPGTMSENISDAVSKGRHKPNAHACGWQKDKTECKRGHSFTPENTKINSRGGRTCRTCQKMHQAKYDAKRRGYEQNGDRK